MTDGENEPFVESTTDRHETKLEYSHGRNFPWWVAAVWIVALTSLAAYTVHSLFPDLFTWGMP